MKKLFARILAVSILTQLYIASASILDTSFNPGTGANGIVEQVLPLADGHIMVCGNFTTFNGRNHPYIARLNSDGSLDESFFGQASYWVRHMSVQSDGKIVIGGFFNGVQGVSRNLVARLNTDGSLDTSFNPGAGCQGTLGVAIDGNADPFVIWTAIQPDGKILITGNFTNYNTVHSFGVVRINPDGSRDTTFNVGSGLDSWGRHIEVLPNNQILLSGWFNNYNNHSANRLALVNPDGSPDTSFNAYIGDQTSIYSTARLPNGQYMVSGHSINPNAFTRETERLNANGSVDSSYVGYTSDKTESLVVQPDGKIIFGGYFTTADGQTKTSVARFNSDGTLDTSWGASIDNYVWTVALDSNGRCLISGGFYTVDGVTRGGVARLLTGSSGGGTPPPPTAPTLSASANSSSQITLTWSDSATDRNGYSVERKTGSGGTYAAIATLGASARTFVNTGVAASTTYYYRLRATTTSGASVYSNESGATTSATSGGGGGTATAAFVGSDSSTRGTWRGVYGSEGYGIFEDGAAWPSYANVTGINTSEWIWQYSTTDTRAPQKASSSSDRIAACLYASSGYSLDIAFTDTAKHRTSLYFLDWDSSGRSETVQLTDANTGAVLNTQTVSGFSGGVYLTWDLSGHIKINITPNAGNAVASAIFFGGGGGGGTTPTTATPTISPNGGSFTAPVNVTLGDSTAGAQIRYTLNGTDPTTASTLYSGPFSVSASATVKAKAFASGMNPSATASATFTISTGGGTSGSGFVYIGADTTHQGTWIGTYGENGYAILPTTGNYPAYAQLKFINQLEWIWNNPTRSLRGLENPDGAGRIAGCWYSSTSFAIDLNLIDGRTHRFAIYLCDWDYAGRIETVDLINVATGKVVQSLTESNFGDPRYLIWDLKGHFQIRVTHQAGPNAVISGFFFGPPARQL